MLPSPGVLKPPAVVLWGGRHLIDIQFGSSRDLRRARQLAARAERLRILRRMNISMERAAEAIGDAMRPVFDDVARSMERFAAALREGR